MVKKEISGTKWRKYFKWNAIDKITTVYLKVKDGKVGLKTMNSDPLAQKHGLVHIEIIEKRDNHEQERFIFPFY